MAIRYDVNVKIISQKGTCPYGHKLGDEWMIKGTSPEGLCLMALVGMYPKARVLMFGGIVPWEPDPEVTHHACSDGKNPIIFELRRMLPEDEST